MKKLRLIAGSALALLPALALAGYEVNIPKPATPISQQIYGLHMEIMYICLSIFVVVFGVMFYSLFAHRKSKGAVAAHFHENTTVEVVWTVIPFLILALIAFPATKTVLAMKDASNPDMTIKITGYQWMWQYEYLNDGVKFYSLLSTPRDQIGSPEEHGKVTNEHYLLETNNNIVVPSLCWFLSLPCSHCCSLSPESGPYAVPSPPLPPRWPVRLSRSQRCGSSR